MSSSTGAAPIVPSRSSKAYAAHLPSGTGAQSQCERISRASTSPRRRRRQSGTRPPCRCAERPEGLAVRSSIGPPADRAPRGPGRRPPAYEARARERRRGGGGGRVVAVPPPPPAAAAAAAVVADVAAGTPAACSARSSSSSPSLRRPRRRRGRPQSSPKMAGSEKNMENQRTGFWRASGRCIASISRRWHARSMRARGGATWRVSNWAEAGRRPSSSCSGGRGTEEGEHCCSPS